MSSETDNPRQRTVAELLAQHGGSDSASTGRRRRRRASDEPPDDLGGPGPDSGAGAAAPDWSPPPAEPAPRDRAPGPASGWDSPRPPAALPQQFSPPAGAGLNGAPFTGGTPVRGMPTNGVPPNGSPPTGQWAPPARREADRGWPSGDPARDAAPGYWPQEAEPDPRRGQRPDQQPTATWDAQPRPTGAWEARPWEPAPVDPQATGQRGPTAYGAPRPDPSPRDQPPPRAFPPGPEQRRAGPPPAPSPHAGSAPLAASASPFAPPRPPVDEPTAQAPAAYPGRPPVDDPGLTGPIDQQRLEAARQSEATSRVQLGPAERRADPDGGPATVVGIPPTGAEDWHRARTGQDGPPTPDPDDDGGPATQAAQLDLDDLDDYDEIEEFRGQPAGLGPKRGDTSGGRGHDADEDAETAGGQSWAPVLAQWVIGAIGGAALWVGFRFLWSNLLVVAIAASVLVTVGLVIVVRALLRNRDLRTTLAAVLVGILLTVSPAVLVLLGR